MNAPADFARCRLESCASRYKCLRFTARVRDHGRQVYLLPLLRPGEEKCMEFVATQPGDSR